MVRQNIEGTVSLCSGGRNPEIRFSNVVIGNELTKGCIRLHLEKQGPEYLVTIGGDITGDDTLWKTPEDALAAIETTSKAMKKELADALTQLLSEKKRYLLDDVTKELSVKCSKTSTRGVVQGILQKLAKKVVCKSKTVEPELYVLHRVLSTFSWYDWEEATDE